MKLSLSTNNPILAVLDCIPYTNTVLSLELADELNKALGNKRNTNNKYIMLLVTHLAQAGLIELSELKPVGCLGTVYFIKKI